jgi:CheY-like chemotaxis protein
MNDQLDPEPIILVLSFDPSIRKLLTEVLTLDGFTVTTAYTAAETLERLEHDAHPAIVLMDNYQVSEQARAFAHTLFARPDLHQRVKLVGLAVQRWEELAPLDEYLRMPFSARDLFELIDRLCATLTNGK